jgi:hypothetical protein
MKNIKTEKTQNAQTLEDQEKDSKKKVEDIKKEILWEINPPLTFVSVTIPSHAKIKIWYVQRGYINSEKSFISDKDVVTLNSRDSLDGDFRKCLQSNKYDIDIFLSGCDGSGKSSFSLSLRNALKEFSNSDLLSESSKSSEGKSLEGKKLSIKLGTHKIRVIQNDLDQKYIDENSSGKYCVFYLFNAMNMDKEILDYNARADFYKKNSVKVFNILTHPDLMDPNVARVIGYQLENKLTCNPTFLVDFKGNNRMILHILGYVITFNPNLEKKEEDYKISC